VQPLGWTPGDLHTGGLAAGLSQPSIIPHFLHCPRVTVVPQHQRGSPRAQATRWEMIRMGVLRNARASMKRCDSGSPAHLGVWLSPW
jgi:hypothetical protein